MFVKPPYLIRMLYPQLIWKVDTPEKIIYLSFDDGPHPDITSKVLDILRKYKAKATFFCLGKNVEKHPDTYKQILREGHLTANHTFNHFNGWKTNNNLYYEDIEACAKVVNSSLFRPPYGRITPIQTGHIKISYRIIMWSVLSLDYDKKTTPQKCLENVVRNSSAGSIVVFHDSEKASRNMLFALPRFLEQYSQQGYRFNTLVTEA